MIILDRVVIILSYISAQLSIIIEFPSKVLITVIPNIPSGAAYFFVSIDAS